MLKGALVVAAVAIAVSVNTLAGGFVWDDLIQIVGNPWIQAPGHLGEAFATHVVGFAPGLRTSFYRPLVHVVYLGVHAAAGTTPWAYHAVNVVLHAAVSTCVYLLALRFTQRWPALLAAVLFAVHPVHSEAVAWASGIYDLAVALFVLLATLALTDERRRVRLVAPALFAFALLWKEPAMAFLPIAALFVAARREARWRELAALALVAVAYLALRVWALGGLTGGDRNPLAFSPLEGVLTAVAVLAEYATLLVLPVQLTPIHAFPIVTSPADLRFVLGCAIGVLLGATAWLARRRPPAVLGLAILVLPLLPALYIPALRDSVIAERYLYLPSAGAALLAALALERWAPARVPVAVAALVCAVAMVVRNAVWHDSVTLWTDTVAKAPTSAVAWENLGGALAVDRRHGEAIAPLREAVRLDPRRVDAQTNLAIALGATGDRAEAQVHALAAIAVCPSCEKPRQVLEWLSR